ncbi:MAG: hypothetical protein EOP36_01580 [Rubrivivax sp.]|nr:MAG: hypothetical protein EOP36_01580 [Rubrivivax sp.]
MSESFFYRFSNSELTGLKCLKDYAKKWAEGNQCTLGVAEMALGAALVSAGWQNGALQMGVDFVAHKLNPGWAAELAGGGGAGIAGLAAHLLGNVGVAAAGTALCIPALALAGGAALVFGLAGYGSAKLIQDFLQQAPSLEKLVSAAGMVSLGVWLIIDGARRVPMVRNLVAEARDAGLHLIRVAGALVIDSAASFAALVEEEVAPFIHRLSAPGVRAAFTGAAGLGAVGAVLAPSFVTVGGSTTLGSAALAIGLVSAPVWPIAVGAGIGLAAGYGLWILFRDDSSKAAPQ